MAVRRKKFDINEALSMTAGAVAGGAAAAFVSDKIGEFMPDTPEIGAFAPIALGAYLSQNKNKMLSAAGLGMIGSSGGVLLETFGIGVNGVGRSSVKRLNPAQQKTLLDTVMSRKQMQAAGVSRAQMESQLAGLA